MWGIAGLEADRGIWVVCYVAIALRGDNFLSKFRGLSGLSAGVCGFGGGGMGIPYCISLRVWIRLRVSGCGS